MPVYQPGIPTGQVKLSLDYLNVQGNFEQANVVYGTDHYPFNNATSNQGFHNVVTTPAFVDNPATGLPPVTTTNPKLYSFQQYAAMGVRQYSRGVNNEVPTPLTSLQSQAADIPLGPSNTADVMDFTGISQAICVLYGADMDPAKITFAKVAAVVIWTGTTFSIDEYVVGTPASFSLRAQAGGTGNRTLQLKNNSLVTMNKIHFTLQFIRVQ